MIASLALNNQPVYMKFIFAILFISALFANCNRETDKTFKLAGDAQGTTWHITYLSEKNIDVKPGIDSIFKEIDSSLSTYLPGSIISRINKNDTAIIADDYFVDVFNQSINVSEKTQGLFDITVAPVINAWGFGFAKRARVDSTMIDSLLDFVGYKKVRLEGRKLIKEMPQSMLDFNAIAPGYTVDVLSSYLETKGITSYLVELGGEVRAQGKKNEENYWMVGIDQPNEEPTGGRPLKAIIQLKDRALATSGNYRKFYVEDGKKRAHIIDPHTGYPAKHNLLSATVLAADCATADAYATAFMVMGVEKAKQFLSEHQDLQLEVFFIYDENGIWKTFNSATLNEWIKQVP